MLLVFAGLFSFQPNNNQKYGRAVCCCNVKSGEPALCNRSYTHQLSIIEAGKSNSGCKYYSDHIEEAHHIKIVAHLDVGCYVFVLRFVLVLLFLACFIKKGG